MSLFAVGYLNPEKSKPCKGYYYRYTEQVFLDKRGALVTTSKWTPLKRRSCPGCNQCNGYDLESEAKDSSADAVEVHCDNPQHGQLYYARNVVNSWDHETGDPDGAEWHMLKVPVIVADSGKKTS